MDEEFQAEYRGKVKEKRQFQRAPKQSSQYLKRLTTSLKKVPSVYGRWCKNYLQYMVRPGWREDDADKPLTERTRRIAIHYHFGVQQGTNRQMFIAEISGLIPNDIPTYTLEARIFNIPSPQERLRDNRGQNGKLIRTIRRPLDRRILDFQSIYDVEGNNVAARVLITYGEDGNPTVLEGALKHLTQLYEEGIIDLEKAAQ